MPNETMILYFLKPVYLHPFCIIKFLKFIQFTFKFQLDKNLPNVLQRKINLKIVFSKLYITSYSSEPDHINCE
jgi:hypothetical protein